MGCNRKGKKNGYVARGKGKEMNRIEWKWFKRKGKCKGARENAKKE